MTKRPSLFGAKPQEPAPAAPTQADEGRTAMSAMETASGAPAIREAMVGKYPKASTREGKRVITAYIAHEAFRQLKRIAADEDAQQQDLFVEAINLLFEKRGLSRIA